MLYYIYLLILVSSFLFSTYKFNTHPVHFKLLAVLLGICSFNEILAMPLFKYTRLISNIPIYNCYLLIETCFYALYFECIIESNKIKKLILFFLFLFPIFWTYSTFYIFNIEKWNSYTAVIESVFTISVSAIYYYQIFTAEKVKVLKYHPEFWVSTALILYYSFNLPYLGMLGFLIKNYLPLSRLFLTFLQVLNIMMYSFFIYAFLCQTITRKSLS